MAEEVDELFGAGAGQPKPRTALITALVIGGIVSATLGLACTSLPGVLMLLGAWSVAETEHDRIDSGYLPTDSRGKVQALRLAAWVGVLCGLVVLVIQGWLLMRTPVYEAVWGGFIDAVLLPMVDRIVGAA